MMEQRVDIALSDVHTHGSSLNILEPVLKSKEIDCLQCSLLTCLVVLPFCLPLLLEEFFRSLTENNTKSQSG